MFMCEECNYIWEEQPRYIGDPETTHCPLCGSAEIEETRSQNLAQPDAYSLLSDLRSVLINDHNTLTRNGMEHIAVGVFRSIYLLDEFIREHFR